jgi:hypothetical protein
VARQGRATKSYTGSSPWRGCTRGLVSAWEGRNTSLHLRNPEAPTTVTRSDFLRFWRGKFLPLLPPARLLVIFLVVLGGVSVVSLRGFGLASLLLLPFTAVAADLLLQRARFDALRWPDAALASGLIVALLLPPSVNLLEGSMVALTAVVLRHALRMRGRPWMNPAAAAVLLGVALFIALGLLLALRQPGRWRLPVIFWGIYTGFSAFMHLLLGGASSPQLLFLEAFDPSVLFFGFFMVTEPRTAPSRPAFQPMYAAVVALASATLPIFLPNIGILVALVVGNALAFLHRRSGPAPSSARVPRDGPGGRGRNRGSRSGGRARSPVRLPTPSVRWPAWQRAGTLLVLLILLVGAATSLATQNPQPTTTIVSAPPGTGGGGATYSNCQQDNPSIPSGTLSQLHRMLGPSVILSYDANTGVVVFYDPVNHVTVTETDLYEDYGFAEFNGDDYAISGCSG